MIEQKGREVTHLRYDLIPGLFKAEIASIFTEGAAKYGENNWKNQPAEFYRDCLNHAQVHLDKFNDGDHSENQLAKVAWNVLAALWYYKEGWKFLGHDRPKVTLKMEAFEWERQTAEDNPTTQQIGPLEKVRRGL